VNGKQHYDVHTIEPDGSGDRLLVHGGFEPSWSPDGERLAYARGSDLCVVRADGTHRRCETLTDVVADPTWSPDGRWIAYYGYGGNTGVSKIRADFSGRVGVLESAVAPDW
jgi:hypothetical protein